MQESSDQELTNVLNRGDVSRIGHRSRITTGFLVAPRREWSLTSAQSKKRGENNGRDILFSREERANSS